MSLIGFKKVTTVPGTMDPDSLYFVLNGTYAETYVTDASGTPKMVGNSVMINALIQQALADWESDASALDIVPDIAARNALIATLDRNAMILVVDATGDPTVSVGSALYAYANDTATTYKLAEYESMDVVVQWGSIQGRPTSTPAQIDASVSQAHSHSNKSTLDKFGESGGELQFGGAPLKTSWTTNNW